MTSPALLRPFVGISVLTLCPRLHPGCVLISQRLTSLGCGTLQLPGGHLEYGESFEECARRELKEETNLECSQSSLKLVLVTDSLFTVEDGGPRHYVTLLMRTEIDDDSLLQWMEPDKNTEWKWVRWTDLKDKNLFAPLRKAVDDPLFDPFADVIIKQHSIVRT
jgi:8-oxo-dGTP diphosphatase